MAATAREADNARQYLDQIIRREKSRQEAQGPQAYIQILMDLIEGRGQGRPEAPGKSGYPGLPRNFYGNQSK